MTFTVYINIISSHPSLGFSALFFLNVIRTTEILKLTEVLRLPFGHFDQERVREVDASRCRILGWWNQWFFLDPKKHGGSINFRKPGWKIWSKWDHLAPKIWGNKYVGLDLMNLPSIFKEFTFAKGIEIFDLICESKRHNRSVFTNPKS